MRAAVQAKALIRLGAWLSWMVLVAPLIAQPRPGRPEVLPEAHHKNGADTLRAFAPVVESTRDSVVEFFREDHPLALGAVVTSTGLVLTKASEISGGAIRCRLADGVEVPARVVKVDDANDLALVRLEASALRPVVWADGQPALGQWTVTPGRGPLPEAVGIVSAPPRRIQHRRALMGVVLDLSRSEAWVARLVAGLGAERAGVAPGDRVMAVNDAPVETREELMRRLREFREGQTVRVQIERGEAVLELDVEMQVPPSDPATRPLDPTERMNRMGSELSGRADGFVEALAHDTVLQAWQCGGPLLNLEGKAVGLNIARAGRAASYALPAARVRAILELWLAGIDSAE